jgi:aminopeptidase YwaD
MSASLKSSFVPDAARLWRHWRVLCQRIGERRAGSWGETAAADYLQKQLRRLGLDSHLEPFACTSLKRSEVRLSVQTSRGFRSVPARALVGAPATPGRRELTAELVWVEMPEQAGRLFTPALRGKIVVLFGPLPTEVRWHRKLVSLAPAAVIHVDDRLPFEWLKDDGVYPLWATRYGMPPTVCVPYRIAWELRKRGARRARLRVQVDQQQGTSQNVVAEIAGRRPDLPLVVVSAHHDTQCHNSGADDNASGAVALIEIAALCSRQRPLRTIRFISFGTEEQLSVGSARYVEAHRRELARIGVVLNLDGLSSVLGHNFIFRAGSPEFGRCVRERLARNGLDVTVSTEISPFGDHFPFSVYGIPALTLSRPNMNSFMRWQHHSAHDNLREVSVEVTVRAVGAVAGLTAFLARSPKWPFGPGLDPTQRAQTHQFARQLYALKV